MPARKKVTIRKKQDRKFDIDKLLIGMNHGSSVNAKSLCTRINTLMDWDDGFLYYDRINRHAADVLDKLITGFNIDNIEHLRVKCSQVNGLLDRTCLDDDRRFYVISKQVRRQFRSTCIDWKRELLPQFKTQRQFNTPCGIISCFYSFGILANLDDIFETTLINDGIHNYLNLNSGVWYLKNGIEVPIPNEMKSILKSFVLKSKWLIAKNNGEPYAKGAQRTLAYHGIRYRLKKIRLSYHNSNPVVDYSYVY